MGRIAVLDDGLSFDGRTADIRPLGGAESAVISLAEALAKRGHDVAVYNRCAERIEHNRVSYRPLNDAGRADAEHVIANRSAKLLERAPAEAATTLWLHNDARYLRKWRHAWPMMRFNPACVVLSDYHARTLPSMPRQPKAHKIPLGVNDWFRAPAVKRPPPPRAVFTSNPERGLKELLEVWTTRIHGAAPDAELHLFTRADFYGVQGKASEHAHSVISYARSLKNANVHLHEMMPRRQLAQMYGDMRTMLYWGDKAHAETFCLSVAEAQAAGVPCVARPIGAVKERVSHGETGFLEMDADRFAAAAISLLTDDEVWRACHERTTCAPPTDWDVAAARFEAIHA